MISSRERILGTKIHNVNQSRLSGCPCLPGQPKDTQWIISGSLVDHPPIFGGLSGSIRVFQWRPFLAQHCKAPKLGCSPLGLGLFCCGPLENKAVRYYLVVRTPR